MMRDGDDVSRYIDPLINKYFVPAIIMCDTICDNDIRQCPLAYNFDAFLNYSNFRYVKHVDLLPEHTNVLTVPNFIYHCLLYATFDHWIQSIIPLLRLLVKSSQLNEIYSFLSPEFICTQFFRSFHCITLNSVSNLPYIST